MSRKASQEQFSQTLGELHPNLVFLAIFVLSILLFQCSGSSLMDAVPTGLEDHNSQEVLKISGPARGQGKSPHFGHKDTTRSKVPLQGWKTHCKKMHPVFVSHTRSNQMGALSPSKLSNAPKGIRMISSCFAKIQTSALRHLFLLIYQRTIRSFLVLSGYSRTRTTNKALHSPRFKNYHTITWSESSSPRQKKSHLEVPQVICSACENHKHHLSQATGSWWQILSSGVQKAKLCLRLSAVFTLLPVI